MTKATFARYHGTLQPVGDEARELLDSIKNFQEVMVDIRTARNPRFHRLFFKMLHILVENSEHFDSVEQALTALKIAIGEADPVIDDATGKTFWTLRSINFESCDQARFNRIFDRSLYVICQRWLQGTDEEELRQEIYRLADGESRSSLGKRVA